MIDKLVEELISKYKIVDLEWYSWPQTFATTGGPRGCGGNLITSHQVYAFEIYTEDDCLYLKWCSGVWKKWDREFMGRW